MKFRGKRKYGNEVITGYYNAIDGVHHYIFNDDNLNSPDWFEIDPTTLAMGTGVTDKNGTMIYGSVPVEGKMSKGGDVVTYYKIGRYIQQSHLDVRPEIDEAVIEKCIDEIVFYEGAFVCKKTIDECGIFLTIETTPLQNIDDVISAINYNKEYLLEEEQKTDCNGNEINESVLGITITGKQYEI